VDAQGSAASAASVSEAAADEFRDETELSQASAHSHHPLLVDSRADGSGQLGFLWKLLEIGVCGQSRVIASAPDGGRVLIVAQLAHDKEVKLPSVTTPSLALIFGHKRTGPSGAASECVVRRVVVPVGFDLSRVQAFDCWFVPEALPLAVPFSKPSM